MKKWGIIKSETVWDSEWYRVIKEKVRLPNGLEYPDYYLVDSPNVAMVVPVLTNGNLLMVRQYKHGAKRIMQEFPAGYIKDDETPQEAVERELMEETGYLAKTIEKMGKVCPMPTRARQLAHLFVAHGLVTGGTQQFDETENIKLVELPVNEAVKKVMSGKIWASDAVAALFMYMGKYQANKKWL